MRMVTERGLVECFRPSERSDEYCHMIPVLRRCENCDKHLINKVKEVRGNERWESRCK
jgi:hypothetical protein